MACAYFERAEAADRAIERIFLYTQAVDDWEHYLRIDPQGEWDDALRESARRFKEKLKQQEQSRQNRFLSQPTLPAQVTKMLCVPRSTNVSRGT